MHILNMSSKLFSTIYAVVTLQFLVSLLYIETSSSVHGVLLPHFASGYHVQFVLDKWCQLADLADLPSQSTAS